MKGSRLKRAASFFYYIFTTTGKLGHNRKAFGSRYLNTFKQRITQLSIHDGSEEKLLLLEYFYNTLEPKSHIIQ